MDIQNVKAAVDELGRTWNAFRAENGRRSGRSEAALGKMNARMDRLEAAIRRAGRTRHQETAKCDYGPKARAYFDYLRHGTRDEPNARRDALSREEIKALSVGADPTAGYLAPVEYAREIIKGEVKFSPLREVARIRQTARRAVQIPRRRGQFAALWAGLNGR